MHVSALRYLCCLSIFISCAINSVTAQTRPDQPAPTPTALVTPLLDTVDREAAAKRVADALHSAEQAVTAAKEQQDSAGEAMALERRARMDSLGMWR